MKLGAVGTSALMKQLGVPALLRIWFASRLEMRGPPSVAFSAQAAEDH